MIPGRSYTIAAGVDVDSADAKGVLWAAGGAAGGHALYVKDNKLRYTFNWIGSRYQDVIATASIAAGHHMYVADFTATGRSTDPQLAGTAGTLTLYIDEDKVGEGRIVTQPGYFCLTGDGTSVGARQRISGVTGVRRAVRIHRRHHREGRRRRERRTLRRPRGPGHRMVHEGLSAETGGPATMPAARQWAAGPADGGARPPLRPGPGAPRTEPNSAGNHFGHP